MKTLVLYAYHTDQLSYYDDWIDAFKSHQELDVTCVDVYSSDAFIHPNAYREIKRLIEYFDLIILHHSMNGDSIKFTVPFVSALKNRKGKLVSFVGNEVNLLNIGMAPKIELLKKLDVDIIITQLLLEGGAWLYKECKNSKVISLPHGLNPKHFFSQTNFKDRKIDIGTRSARYGPYLGDNDRNNIIDHFRQNTYGLTVDVGEDNKVSQRFDRKGWRNFLDNCKATLATEAGSFYLESNDEMIGKIKKFLSKKSSDIVLQKKNLQVKRNYFSLYKFFVNLVKNTKGNTIFEKLDEDLEADFSVIYEHFFRNVEKAPVYTKCISSRHFDAVGTCTLQIMYPGRYNDILKPNQHYFELKKDHSNIEDLLSLLADSKRVQSMTSLTYDYVLENHTHRHRVESLLNFI